MTLQHCLATVAAAPSTVIGGMACAAVHGGKNNSLRRVQLRDVRHEAGSAVLQNLATVVTVAAGRGDDSEWHVQVFWMDLAQQVGCPVAQLPQHELAIVLRQCSCRVGFPYKARSNTGAAGFNRVMKG